MIINLSKHFCNHWVVDKSDERGRLLKNKFLAIKNPIKNSIQKAIILHFSEDMCYTEIVHRIEHNNALVS